MTDYAAPDLLVDPAWLADHLSDPKIRVIEMAQDPAPFEEGHIPGAVFSPDWQIKGTQNTRLVAPPEEAKAWFESAGIGDGTLVVGYDRSRNRDAARLWWVLSYYGHANVKVLNGGWKRWSAEGRAIETGSSAASTASAVFTPGPANYDIESTADKLKAAVGDSAQAIWDIRAADEFSGENSRGNSRSGHVPGAVHLEWVDLVNEADHTFKPADELKALLDAKGITPGKPVHIY